MKKALTFLVLAVAILTTSCIKEANAPENEMTTCPATGLPSTYLGKWKLAGEMKPTGESKWEAVSNGFELNVKADSTYTVSTADDFIIGTGGRVDFRNKSTWFTNYSHGIRSVVPEANVYFNSNCDTFYMVSYVASKDLAALKFARIKSVGTVQ
ncbi:hypothetical protein HNQ91_004739 [Filimonas zeae]|uniref:Lipocalin-like domain-containing protein n=1 Tax=Filimonas zeae TaxID=1737353 RepID=A0A917J1P5_9BACT|nr:hypothetical protein [Filimonas zeae]MDR6341666.1 hypothetical protein [Filimonas zeae]GGH74746.1 hypothetical protein GCM10011379_37630 [Filimonas zeae]